MNYGGRYCVTHDMNEECVHFHDFVILNVAVVKLTALGFVI